MNDQLITIDESLPPAPEEAAPPAAPAIERIEAPDGLGALLVAQQEDGWRAGYEAKLPDAIADKLPVLDWPHMTRADAITEACMFLSAWCAGQESGKKAHRKAASRLREWCADMALVVECDGLAALTEACSVESAPVVPAALNAAPGALLIPIEDVHQSALNPRQIYPHKEMLELIVSMRNGWRAWQPALARPRAEGGFELAAGHRRLRAALACAIQSIPCIVQEMTDSEFLDVLNFDNSQRSDVHPLHEAAGWRVWMEKTGGTVLDIAARIGQSKEYVYQRLQYSNLIEPAQEAFLDNKMTGAHAVQIARLPERYQVKALDHCCCPTWDQDRHVSVRNLATWIKQNCMLSLRAPGFDPADENLLPVSGSCIACPKRSGANPELFADLEDEEICTDPACYRSKQAAAEAARPQPAPVAPAAQPALAPPPAPKRETVAQRKEQAEEERRRAEEAKRAQLGRDAESERARREEEHTDRVYAKALDEILKTVFWPLAQEDLAGIFTFLVGSLESCTELRDKFAIVSAGEGVSAWRDAHSDLVIAARKLSEQKLSRIMVAGILMDVGILEGRILTSEHPLAQFAKRHKVDLEKISKAVDEEMNPQPAATAAAPKAPAKKAAKAAPAKKKSAKPAKPKAPMSAVLRKAREGAAKKAAGKK